MFSGYLKPVRRVDDEKWELSVPNREVHLSRRELVKRRFASKVEENQLEEMLRGLESGDVELFERLLRKIATQATSFHDFGGAPEKVYHALVRGMPVWLSGKYEIRSNRESGCGRYDIMLTPEDKTKQGIVVEFKLVESAKSDAHEQVLEDAMQRIEDRGYASEPSASGISDILEIAGAFRGKELWVRHRNRE